MWLCPCGAYSLGTLGTAEHSSDGLPDTMEAEAGEPVHHKGRDKSPSNCLDATVSHTTGRRWARQGLRLLSAPSPR